MEKSLQVFCCYARRDKDLLDELKAHLSSLQRQNMISLWHDGDISAGTEWDQEIKKHLNDAKIIFLLISADFINSDYCYSTEMQQALSRHKRGEAKAISVIIRPTAVWKTVSSGDIRLGDLQALPTDAKPITSWTNRDEAWEDVVRGTERVINELLLGASVPSVQTGSTRDRFSISQYFVPAGLGARVRSNGRNKNRRVGGTKKPVFQLLLVFVLVMLVIASSTNLGNITSSFIGSRFHSTGGDPVRIDSVSTQYMDDTHVFANALVLSDTELSQLNSLKRTNDPSYEDWFTSQHAVGDTSITLLVLKGNRDHTVRIIGMQPIVSCQSPLSGTLFYSPSAGGDQSTTLGFDLDNPQAPPSYILNQHGTITSGKGFFGAYTVSLNLGEQFTFLVIASTKKQFCKFTLMMTVVDGDKTVTETITNNGQPFQVTSLLPYGYMPEFSDYPVLYVGGIVTTNSLWSRADPKTYSAP